MLEKLLLKLRELFCVHFVDDFIFVDDELICRCKKCGKRIYYSNDSYEYHYLKKDGHEEFWED